MLIWQIDIKYSFQYSRVCKNLLQVNLPLDVAFTGKSGELPHAGQMGGRGALLFPPTCDSGWAASGQIGLTIPLFQGPPGWRFNIFWGSQATGNSWRPASLTGRTIQLFWLWKIKDNTGTLPFRDIRNQLWPFEFKNIFRLHLKTICTFFL